MKTMMRYQLGSIGKAAQVQDLITPMNGPNTELAKNMVLAGANVWIYDPAPITADDF